MNKKYFTKIFITSFVFVFALGLVAPAQAFYLDVPQSVKAFQQTSKKVQSGVTLTQTAEDSSGGVAPIPSTPLNSGGTTPPPSTDQGMQPQQPIQQPQSNETCNINGQEMPGPCSNYQGQAGEGGGGQFEQKGGGQSGPNEEQMKQQQEQQLKQMKRDIKKMELNVLQLERMILGAEKKGTAIPQEIKEKLAKLKSIIEAVKNAQTMDELQSAGMEEMGDVMQELEEYRRNTIEAAQRMQDMKRGIQGMEKGLVMFERQIAKLVKQGTAVPSEITDNLGKIKTIMAAIKAAKTWDEMESAGMKELQDLMQSLDQSRQQLEMLSRWPQTIKQINKEVTRLERELKRIKGTVDRLAKKGINLLDTYNQFTEAVNKLKTVRDEATQKMKDGNSEEAFDLLENDFFGQMEDVWQYSQTINMMSNLGRFASDFKQGIAQSKSTIKNLARKKIDTAELSNILAQAEAKGSEVLGLLKASPVDEEAVMDGIQELDDLRQFFESTVAELTGQEEMMPWEKGNQQFQPMGLPATVQRAIPQKPVQTQEAPQCAPGTVCDGTSPGL